MGAWLAACTLTSDEYEPSLVARETLGPDASANPVGCAPGFQCCEAAACPTGERCTEGQCEPFPATLEDAGNACTGTDCEVAPPPVLAASCTDRVQNGDETGVDCGGSCEASCTADTGCTSDADCSDGLSCDTQSRCVVPSCNDGELNGAEVLADCGGGECTGCPDGTECSGPADCASGVCAGNGRCAPQSCNDGVRNQDETATDCGGSCQRDCGTGQACAAAGDCQSGVCDAQGCGAGVARCCQAPTCDDGVQNGNEPVTDCGNAACGACPVGSPCVLGTQCSTGICQAGECQEDPGTCTDGLLNGTESSADCGGDTCGRCPDGRTCRQQSDCGNQNCDARGICISCGDNVINGTETGVDCGGADPFCRRCNFGEVCRANTDCLSQFCFGGFCG